MTSSIRAFKDQDLDRIVELSLSAWAPIFASFRRVLGDPLYHLAYPDWPDSQARAVRATCTSSETQVWVATLDKQLVGFVASQIKLDRDPLTAEIEMIAVDPSTQRAGIATQLLEHATNHLHENGVFLVEIATGGESAHIPARRLYEKAGFRALPLARYYRRP